jgi:uncharacterized protein YlxW (UPF0749 family)
MSGAPVGERDATRDDGDEIGLLEGFLSSIVVDDYAQVPVDAPAQGGAAHRMAALVVAAVIGVIIVGALISASMTDAVRRQTRDALADRISTLSTAVAERQAMVDDRTAVVDVLQQDILNASAAEGAVAELDRLSAVAATTELTGPGVIVTIDDAPDAEAGSLNRVLDRDLQDIVNALWRSGATGVAVNDQRLTEATAIRAAGEAILVNYQPLTRPYRVQAVGSSTTGSEDSALTSLLEGLARDYGLVTEVSTGDVALPAGELRIPRFATSAGGSGQ